MDGTRDRGTRVTIFGRKSSLRDRETRATIRGRRDKVYIIGSSIRREWRRDHILMIRVIVVRQGNNLGWKRHSVLDVGEVVEREREIRGGAFFLGEWGKSLD